jgi:hypothetical protein|tara:strand:+ start:2069 stop:2734 length:666 start_codon:yes stop_codon:yes gene_type:complete
MAFMGKQRDKPVLRLLCLAAIFLGAWLTDCVGDGTGGKAKEQEKDTAQDVLIPDFTLLKARSHASHRELGGRAPYFTHYRKGYLELVFIAARYEPRSGSPTHRPIEAVIEGFVPACVITEGLGSDEGFSPRGLLRDARRKKVSGNLPEPLYAALVAANKGIPSATVKALRAEGIENDALGFLVALEARLLGEHRRVLVIYGSGHLVYEDMLGSPVRKASRW